MYLNLVLPGEVCWDLFRGGEVQSTNGASPGMWAPLEIEAYRACEVCLKGCRAGEALLGRGVWEEVWPSAHAVLQARERGLGSLVVGSRDCACLW